MSYILITLVTLLCLAILYTCAKTVQLHKFSEFMHDCLDKLYENEDWKTKELCITKSYNNFDRSAAWNYNFQDMVVYVSRIAA